MSRQFRSYLELLGFSVLGAVLGGFCGGFLYWVVLKITSFSTNTNAYTYYGGIGYSLQGPIIFGMIVGAVLSGAWVIKNSKPY